MDDIGIKKLAVEKTPKVKTIFHDKYFRHDILKSLNNNDCIGIELGVAGGNFSKRMVKSGKFKKFFGIDLYEDHHNTKEYIEALKLIGLNSNYTLLRMSFDEAISLFSDSYFDFIYFDGYAHTGEEGGKNFSDWFCKLKVGGIFCGDDYHDDWPLVKWGVNNIVSQLNCDLNVTGKTEDTHLNKYPSWFFKKESEKTFNNDPDLLNLGLQIRKATKNKGKNITLTQDDIVKLFEEIKLKNPQLAMQLQKIL